MDKKQMVEYVEHRLNAIGRWLERATNHQDENFNEAAEEQCMLIAILAHLRQDVVGLPPEPVPWTVSGESVVSRVDYNAQRSAAESMALNDARYRWLRDNPEHKLHPYYEKGKWIVPYESNGAGGFGGGVGYTTYDSLDAAIDAARKGAL